MKTYNLTFSENSKQITFEQAVNTSIEDESLVNTAFELYNKTAKSPKKYDWAGLEKFLNEIYCQQDNTTLIAEEVKKWLKHPKKTKPLVFFLAGTSGTGKTFTAQQIAKGLSEHGFVFEKFDMNSYTSEADVWRLIGSTTGYVGSNETPQIFALREKSDKLVVVFDEIEKAHEKLLLAIMNMLDEGVLADGHGIKHDFKNAIIFLTSNLVMEELLAKKRELLQKGIAIDSTRFQDDTKQIIKNSRQIRNEISGRFDWLLVYNTLDAANVAKIALQEIRKIAKDYDLQINNIHESLLLNIANNCKDNNEGARPVRRIVRHDFLSVFQDFCENNTEKNVIYDIDETQNLVKTELKILLSIDEIVNNIDFEGKHPIPTQPVQSTPHITITSKPYFEKGFSIDNLATAMGLIIGDGHEGTGFIISPNGLLITCAHCVKDGEQVKFLYNSEEIETELIYKNETIDVAILKIDKNDLPYFAITDSQKQLPRNTKMGLLSYPKGRQMGLETSFTKGVISKIENGYYFTDANATHGSSGGAFFKLDDGIVYGVLNGGFGEEGGNMNLTRDIRELFKQNDIKIEWEQ
jgi:Cdc6-like AAA superfamily ATPase